jgi:hypothetical protein
LNKTLKPVIFFGSLLYPIYTLPWLIKSMVKNEYFGYLLFSLFMAYLAYLMIPYDTWDLTRHYETFNKLSTISFDRVFDMSRIFNYILNLYMWSVAQVGLSKEFVPFSFIFMVYVLYFLTFKKIVEYSSFSISEFFLSYKWFMLLGIFFIFNEIRFMGTASGLRNSLAFAIFIFAIMGYYLNHNIFFTFILIVFSIFLHFSVVPLAIIFFLSNTIVIKKFNRVLFLASFFLIISGMAGELFYTIIEFFKPLLQAIGLYFPSYMDPNGEWGSRFYEGKNIKTIILEYFIKPFPFYLAGFYLFFVHEITWSKLQNYLYVLFVFIALVSVSRTLFDRYSYFFVLLFIFLFLEELKSKPLTNFKRLFIAFFIASLLLMDFGGLVKYRDVYVKSWIKIFYIPAPYMVLYDISEKDYIKRESL